MYKLKKLNKILLTMILLLSIAVFKSVAVAEIKYKPSSIPLVITKNKIVEFHNIQLEQVVREVLQLKNQPIKQSDLVTIKQLKLADNYIIINNKQYSIKLKPKDITHFTYLTQLQISKLTITREQIASFPYLKFLEITNSSIDFKIKNKLLVKLALINCNFKNIKLVSSLQSLEQLYLNRNIIMDISEITKLSKLTKLSLSDNKISNITALGDLTGLKELNLKGNEIIRIKPLNHLTKLEILNISYNKIKNLYLKDCINIRELDISNNQIQSISCLKNLKNLEWLNASNNECSDVKELDNLQELAILGLANKVKANIVIEEMSTK